ncbi:hypothetical protein ACWC1L_29145, partial [Streptomyces albidoflavus]
MPGGPDGCAGVRGRPRAGRAAHRRTEVLLTGVGVTVPGTEERLEVKGLFSGAGISWLLEN